MLLPDSSILTNIYVPGNTGPADWLFEKKYITICSMERRLYTDEELVNLPDIAPAHPHYREWKTKKLSMKRLTDWLTAKKRPLNILEIGCGNGWLSHHLGEVRGARVTGMDINFTELQQAARVFCDEPNIKFVHGDICSGILGDMQFDTIVFAASIQYFQSLRKILHTALSLLSPGGEIHILDSPFFEPAEISTQRMRTAAYYASLGYPEMADLHFHHCMRVLRPFHHKVLYNPDSFMNWLLNSKGSCPWICIRNDF